MMLRPSIKIPLQPVVRHTNTTRFQKTETSRQSWVISSYITWA